MRSLKFAALATALVVVLAAGNVLQAAPPGATTITIPDMHCGGCAKRVAAQLQAVPGVGQVQTNTEGKFATVVAARPDMVLSPRALWEAVEKARKTPTKLEGPSGTFTSKPQS